MVCVEELLSNRMNLNQSGSSSSPCNNDDLESSHSSLINGLPDDIALNCLARVPRKYHTVLKCVSRRWRDLVCGDELWTYRHKHKLDETWIYVLCRDKNSDQARCYLLDLSSGRQGCWKPIASLPPRCLKRKGMGFEKVGKKLYLLGGCSWSEDAADEVYCYDVSMDSWSSVAPMSTARCYFRCEALDGKIYAIGGHGLDMSDPRSWDTYDPCTNAWEPHSDPNIILDIEDSAVFSGKIYIRSCASTLPHHVCMAVYNPLTGNWLQTDADMALGWRGPAVVVDETLYVLDQSSGTKLMMWQKDKREWIALRRLPSLLTRPPCQMAAIGTNIYIIGKGRSTVVFDVRKFQNADGVVASSSIPSFFSDEDVISCKCVSI